MKVVDQRRLLLAVDFVHGEKEWAVRLAQQAHEFKVATGEFGAPVDDHNDGWGLVECDTGLAIDFRRDQIFFFGQNAASVHDAQVAAFPLRVAIKAVAGDAGFVSDDGAAGADDAIEECGLAYVGASHDSDCGNAGGGGGESAGRVVSWLGQNEFYVGQPPSAVLGLQAQWFLHLWRPLPTLESARQPRGGV